jgi:ubiquinone/menaquinone biosynthesis C-methylase UbiE
VRERWEETPARRADAAELESILSHSISCDTGRHILDAGCGPGYWTRRVLSRGGATCIGLDMSLARLRLSQGPRVQGMIERMPFRDGVFDAIVAINVLEYVRDTHDALDEMWRVLKPGGRVFIRTKNPTGVPWRLALWASERLHPCPHRPMLVSPKELYQTWPGSAYPPIYFRARLILDLQDVNDAVHWRAPVGVETLLDRLMGHGPEFLTKYLSWHFAVVLTKGC